MIYLTYFARFVRVSHSRYSRFSQVLKQKEIFLTDKQLGKSFHNHPFFLCAVQRENVATF
jgi:hypothetical protein